MLAASIFCINRLKIYHFVLDIARDGKAVSIFR